MAHLTPAEEVAHWRAKAGDRELHPVFPRIGVQQGLEVLLKIIALTGMNGTCGLERHAARRAISTARSGRLPGMNRARKSR